uniref:Uncharacterized protein n=1 Tax=Lactuca sativa TaxID=4236 RepID=A0A9R1W8L1_LACSA|nr:hypothetical protein LSAT_V11C300141760 [Lactuca sativa]
MYSWGRLLCDFTYKQLRPVFDKIEWHLNPIELRVSSRPTYTMQGFVYAFKTLPDSSIVGSPVPGVISQVVADLVMRRLHVADCEHNLDVTNKIT